MKTIYFIRHAKSDWSVECDDFDRGLNKRGLGDVQLMTKRLKKYDIKPDIIISSPAKRALDTAEMIADRLNIAKKIFKTDINLYLTSPKIYLDIIRQIDNKYSIVFIVGHNPTITEVCENLSGISIGNIPTCGIFSMEFNVKTFDEISPNSGKKLFFDFPKKHKT
ncbi:MAG: histidine phosphatase family protein [Campylobacteraceae bacterium]|jgi:phosphohistidine phosphatase|nr:histidine phosphatase family protein [Campylobacteraceae bacterium]